MRTWIRVFAIRSFKKRLGFIVLVYFIAMYTVMRGTLLQEKDFIEEFMELMNGGEDDESPTPPPQTMPPLNNGFQLVFPHVEPILSPEDKNLYLVVMVTSSAIGKSHRNLRNVIRKTWGNTTLVNPKALKWKVFFSMAISTSRLDNADNYIEAIWRNDVIIGNFSEEYHNLVVKTFMGHYWVLKRLSCRFILKADDDVYVRVPRLITWLNNSGSPSNFYGGYISYEDDLYEIIQRDPDSPWYVSYEEYNETSYPPWCRGPFYVISYENIPKYLGYIHIRNPFKTEDTYTAVISYELGINATFIPGFHIKFVRTAYRIRELYYYTTLGHKLTASDMSIYHRFYVIRNLTNI